MKVLIVDDDDNNREILKRMVQLLGHAPSTAASGGQGVEAARSALGQGEPFDRVFLDMRMPDMSGSDAAKEMREIAGFSSSVFALTGDDKADIDMSAFDGYLQKPFTLDDIKAALA
jgi:CheY-like chemotaxis protein